MPATMVELAGGVKLACRIEGAEKGDFVVLSNSLCTNMTLWDDLVPALADRYRILRYDQRGHGLSSPAEPPYDMDELVLDVVALLDHFRIEAAHVCGVSMGGGTGLGLAIDHPKRIKSLVMCDSMGGKATGHEWDERIEAVKRDGLKPQVEPTVTRWFAPASVAAKHPAIEKVGRMVAETSVAGFVGCASALQTYDYRPRVGEIKIPSLLLAGSEDGNRPEQMRQLAGHIPGAKFVSIPGAGHLPNIEKPAEFNAAVRAFLDAVA